jgi:ketosteroid isomerase-like protein
MLITTLFALVGLSQAQSAVPLAVQAMTASSPALPPVVAVDTFHDALSGGRADAALKLLSDDVLIYESGRAERSKAEYASHHLKADTEFASATQRKLLKRASWIGADTAWVTSETETTGSFRGRPIALTGAETMLLRRTAGEWKIVHIHWSSATKR